MSIPHIALALAVTVLWGFSFVVMRELVDALPPLMVAGLRVAIAALPVLILFRPPSIRWYWTLGIGLTQGTIQMSLLFFAMEFGMPAGLSSLLLQSQVFFTTIFAFAILGERPGRAQYAGHRRLRRGHRPSSALPCRAGRLSWASASCSCPP